MEKEGGHVFADRGLKRRHECGWCWKEVFQVLGYQKTGLVTHRLASVIVRKLFEKRPIKISKVCHYRSPSAQTYPDRSRK